MIRRTRLDRVTITRVNGDKVSTETLVEELKLGAPMILLHWKQSLDPRFAVMFQPHTLVLQLRDPWAPATAMSPTGVPRRAVPVAPVRNAD